MRRSWIVALGTVLALLTPVLGTQVVAYQLRYATWLGTPLWWGLYAPHKYVVWSWHFSWYYPAPFDWGLAVMGGWLVSGGVLIAVLLKRSGWQRRTAYGNAEWATAQDIRRAKLFVHLRK